MPDNLSRRIDREALERIIQRAAELQAGEMDTGEGMTEPELLKLGAEVGIPSKYLRQALYEERADAGVAEEGGFLARWIGPGRVSAGRVVPGDRTAVEQALEHWMIETEALAVKRRLPDATVWERQKGFFAEMKRGFGVGGRSYELAKAQDVTVRVTQLEPGFCHVEMTADLTPTRGGAAVSAVAATGALGLVGIGMVSLVSSVGALLAPLALVPLAAAAGSPLLASRAYRRRRERMQLNQEQVLDRLERGEIKPRHQLAGPRGPAFVRIAAEIRKAIAEISEPTRQPPRGLPPTT
ncbi:MAG: hypothetical protein HYR48_04045 [Gemmatimonadetes bacterium]|nr:hypothetical protein [Gemmatimonadota bacterium]